MKKNYSLTDHPTEENNLLGVIRKGADVYRDILSGRPVVIAQPKSDIAIAYNSIASKI